MTSKMLNFNVGVLGHVDSGKTSLAKALSTIESTASFDKNPQSKERGITLDLGFSSFCVDAPEHIKKNGFSQLQFTLVDCPGHASLIRTIIGGAQIIDLMLLVIDAVKGVQTQTAECLIIGEMTCDKMIVVLNKVDLYASDKQQQLIEKMQKRLLKTLENTKFAGSPIIPVAARPGGAEVEEPTSIGLDILIDMLKQYSFLPERQRSGPLVFAVDHCFSIKGQGTVMTGTVLSGSVTVNDTVEIPSLKVTKKVKSMQMFHNPVDSAMQGDRVGLCVTQFDPKLLERGLVCSPAALPTVFAAIISAIKISYFKSVVTTKARFHITTMHETVMGRLTVFGDYTAGQADSEEKFDFTKEYLYQDELLSTGKGLASNEEEVMKPKKQYILVEFDHPVICTPNGLVIGSRFDTDIHANVCRLAFQGRLLVPITEQNYTKTVLPQLKVFKRKTRKGVVERKLDDYTVICRGMFKKESKMDTFIGLKVVLSTGEEGKIEGGFGQSGKFKVRLQDGLKAAKQILESKSKKKGKGAKSEGAEMMGETELTDNIELDMDFKRYLFDPEKKIKQM